MGEFCAIGKILLALSCLMLGECRTKDKVRWVASIPLLIASLEIAVFEQEQRG